MLRKILVLSLVVVMALPFVACDGGSGLPSAEEIIEASIEALDDVRTFEFEMEASMDADTEAEGEPNDAYIEMDASGAIDIENYQMQLAMDMNMETTGEEDMDMAAEMYLVDDTFYILTDALGMGSMWMKLELSDIEELPEGYGEQEDMSELQTEMLEFLPELLEAFEIEVTGSERVDGIDCYVLESNPDTEQLWEMFMEMFETMELETTDIPEDTEDYLDEMFDSFSVKQWIAKDTYLTMKVELEINMEFSAEDVGEPEEEGEADIDMSLTVLVYDYNQPVSIELPPGAEDAMDITELMDFTDYMDY